MSQDTETCPDTIFTANVMAEEKLGQRPGSGGKSKCGILSAGFELLLCCWLVSWPQASYFTFLRLSFLTEK